MTKHQHPKGHKNKTGTYQVKAEAGGEAIIDHATNPEDKKSPTLHKDSTPEKPHPPTPSRFISAVYQWLIHWWDAPREKSKTADWAIAALTVGIAGAAFYSAYIFQSQLTEMRRATEIQERPWLSVEAQPVNGMIFVNGPQPVLKLRLSIKNVGHSIAKNVQIDVKMLPTPAGLPIALDAAQRQRELCDHPKIAQIGAFDMFPVDQPVEREMDISVPPSAADAQAMAILGDKTRRFVGFYVVGCVSYRFSFGPDFHQTRFAYHLIAPVPLSEDRKPLTFADGKPVLMGFEIGVNVPKERVGMTQELFALNDAN